MARRTHHSSPTNLSEDAPKDAVLVDFGRRLQRAMIEKGWNQSELARRATGHMANGEVTRDAISKYINGVTLPGPDRLQAIAKALHMQPADILPTRGITAGAEKSPALDVRDVGEGNVWLRVNQQVEWARALEIMKILKGE